jgi:hypothetical protein
MRGTWQTTGSGSGTGSAVLAIAGVAAAAVVLGPALATVGNTIADVAEVLMITVAVVAGLAVLATISYVAFRLHRRRAFPAAPVPVAAPPVVRAVQARSQPRQVGPARQVHIHHHWHGITPEEVAAVIRRDNP